MAARGDRRFKSGLLQRRVGRTFAVGTTYIDTTAAEARLTDHCGSDSFQAAFPGEFALSTMPPDDRYCVHRQVG